MKRGMWILAAATFALGAAQAADAKVITARFNCSKGRSLKVVFSGSKAIVTPKGGKSVTLRQSMAADGFAYSKGKYYLRGRGDWVAWTVGSKKPLNCYAK